MTVHPKIEPAGEMTRAEFRAFVRSRPDEERWELVEGVPILNASPVNVHQLICGNLIRLLLDQKDASGAAWMPSLGIGTLVPVSPRSLPVPDVYVHEGEPHFGHETGDAIVIFEVLSRSNRMGDQAWRKRVYSSVPNCSHYVTVALKTPRVVAFDRATGWKERKVSGLDATLELDAISATLKLADIYRYTPVGR